jgi:hypothetical protein
MYRKPRKYVDYRAVEIRNAIRQAYHSQKAGAKLRGIDWFLTFDEWCDIWLASGRWAERGNKAEQYCMARKWDEGGYAKDNVTIITNRENQKEKTNAYWNTQHGSGLTKNSKY